MFKEFLSNYPQVDQGGLTLPTREYYLKNDSRTNATLKAFEDMIVSLSVMLAKERDNVTQLSEELVKNMRSQAKDLVAFEIKLANITVPNSERHDDKKLYHKYTINALTNLVSIFMLNYYGK